MSTTDESLQPPSPRALDDIPAKRPLIDLLYSQGKISRQARDEALRILIPHDQWGLWISRLLLSLGVCLILSGVVYFFAFNWAKLEPAHKLGGLQFAIIAGIIGAYVCSLNRLSGQLSLMGASVFVGVFFAVFGQIYQTGADAYQLFMMWSLLTLGWTVISKFAPHWIFWLVISNLFLFLWWIQGVLPREDWGPVILAILALYNAVFLIARELLVEREDFNWLSASWTRWILLLAILAAFNAPILMLIVDPEHAFEGVLIGSIVGFVGHLAAFGFYRLKKKDIWALAATCISGLIIVETLVIKVIAEIFDRNEEAMLLLIGFATIGIVTGFTIYLRKLTSKMEVENA